MNKKLLTLDDLYKFYSSKKKSMKFNIEKDGEPIVVQVKGKMTFETNKDTEGLTAVTLQACHTEKNLNSSSISFETMEQKLLPSFKNRPILGYIHEVNDQPEFYGHNMHIDPETDEIVYEEIAVGIIPESNNAKLVYDEELDRYNVIVDGYIFNDYTKATEILEREQECYVSVEIAIREMAYSAKEKCLEIQDGYFSGVTILGKDENGEIVKPGMSGSNIRLKDFSESNNSMFSDITEKEHSKLIDTLEKLNTTLSNLNINEIQNFSENKEKGGSEQVTKFEELLSKYNKTQEDITFEIDGLSDEELEAKFAEIFEDDSADSGDSTDSDDITSSEDTDEANTDETLVEENSESEENDTIVEETTNDMTTEETSVEESDELEESENIETDAKKKRCELENETNKFSKTFELSHDDIRGGLYELLKPYEEADNDWYWIMEVYDDHFIYQGMTGIMYGQKYIADKTNETISFDGERYEVYVEYLTASEKAELETMRSNYSSIQSELNTYKEAEEKADKMTVFDDESYSNYLETDEFKELMSNEVLKKFTKEELIEKADAALGKLVKKNKTFALNTNNKNENKEKRFFAFSRQERDNDFLDSLLNKRN